MFMEARSDWSEWDCRLRRRNEIQMLIIVINIRGTCRRADGPLHGDNEHWMAMTQLMKLEMMKNAIHNSDN